MGRPLHTLVLAVAAASLLVGCGSAVAGDDDFTSSELVVRPAPDVAPWPTPDPDRPEGVPQLSHETMAELREIAYDITAQLPEGIEASIKLPNLANPRFVVTLAADQLGSSDASDAAALIDEDIIPSELGLTVEVWPTFPPIK